MMLPILFIWYIGSITLFPHTHFAGGVSVVHSHPFTDTEHQGEESILTIDMLCHFHSDANGDGVFLPDVAQTTVFQEENHCIKSCPIYDFHWTFRLRGPPASSLS